ncbi:MAG: phosphate ABC transporter permease subunit PstC [Dehalococcoidia bacterium]|nr:phosphate ABC transporter permease subunit PstC [Dehalococcoidia bacterium]
MKRRYLIDRSSRGVIMVCATASVVVLLAIAVFIFRESLPAFGRIGVLDFLLGTEWNPQPVGDQTPQFGILVMIVGTVLVTAGALIFAAPLGIGCAILLADVAPHRFRRLLRPAVELLVGIPSVVYGLVGLVLIVPVIRQIGGPGLSLAAGIVVLAAMILPTITSISEDSIRAVPRAYREGALALGATNWQTMWRVVIPAARSGIAASIVLGVGRAVGEAMALVMVIGMATAMPKSPLDPARPLAPSIALETSYASGLHLSALFAIGVVLLVFIIVINSLAIVAFRRGARA